MNNNVLNIEKLRALHCKRDTPCVSIYMSTHQVGDAKQDSVRFKNLLHQAEEKLLAHGVRATEARALIEPLKVWESNEDFWQHQRAGLAIFIAEGLTEFYPLPIEVVELVAVADRFNTRELIPIFFADQKFFVLALGLQTMRVFAGDSFSLNELFIHELEGGIVEIRDSESKGSAEHNALLHGHSQPEQNNGHLEQYFHKVNAVLVKVLGETNAPLVLHGVDYLVSAYRKINTCVNLVPEALIGTSESISLVDLYCDARTLVEPYLKKSTIDLIARYHEKQGTGLTSDQIDLIVPAALNGRLEALLLSNSGPIWGNFDAASNQITVDDLQNDTNEDLIDMAVAECILKGGTVVNVLSTDVASANMAAIFRY